MTKLHPAKDCKPLQTTVRESWNQNDGENVTDCDRKMICKTVTQPIGPKEIKLSRTQMYELKLCL